MSLYSFLAVFIPLFKFFSPKYCILMHVCTHIRNYFLIKKFILCYLYKYSPYLCRVQKEAMI